MIKTFLSRVAISVVACLSFFATSCVQEEYKISEETLDLEVTVFQEGISLPLGSTDKIKVGQLVDMLDPEVKDFFNVTDGAYAFGMADKFDFSEQLSFLSENLSIDELSINESVSFNLANVDLSGVNVPENVIPFEQDLSKVIPSVDFKIDPIRPEPFRQTTDIARYIPSEESLNVKIDDFDYDMVVATLDPIDLSAYKSNPLWSTPLSVDEITSLLSMSGFTLDTKNEFTVSTPIVIPLEIKLPKDVKDVKRIDIKDGASVRISLSLSDGKSNDLFFTSGDIKPSLDLDASKIFKDTHIKHEFLLNNQSPVPYSASEIFDVNDIVLDYRIGDKDDPTDGDFHMEDGCLVLYKTVSVTPKMQVAYENLMTSMEKLSGYTDETNVKMDIKIEFLDFVVDNVAVVVDPMVTSINTSVDLDISVPLPEMVNGVSEVTFAPGAGLTLKLDVDNIDRIVGLDFAIENLELTFPEGLDIEGAVNNKLNIEIGSLTDAGVTKHIPVHGIKIDPSTQTPGAVSFDGSVQVEASAKIGVKDGCAINTKHLPTSEDENIALDVSAEVTFDIKDFQVDFAGYYYDVDESQKIEFSVPEAVADLGSVKIVPEGDPVITIDVELPQTGLKFGPSQEGLTIDFPDMIAFKPLSDGLSFAAGNVLKFTDEIPSHIELPIDYILAEGKKIDGKEGYWVSDEFTVKGSVGVAAGIVKKTDIDALSAPDAKVSFRAYIPELKPASVDIKSYQASVPEEKISFGDNLDLSSLPKELVGVGEILLKDVALDISVKAPGINELIKDADVNLAMYVTLPDVIMVEEGLVNADGVMEINGKLENEEIRIDPIEIYGLSLNKTADELAEYLSDLEITYGGNISVENATIDLGALENTDLQLDVDIKLATAGSDKIEIGGVSGYIDYQVDPINESIELGDYLESLNNENLTTTLDLNRFSLALDLKTNLSIPLLAELSIVPYKDGAVMENNIISTNLDIKMPQSTSEPSLIRYWISNYPQGEDQYMPAGYEHISLDVLSLLPLNPDKIDLSLKAGTDPQTLASISPSDNGYVLEAEYAFNLPFEFGEDTKVEFRQVIEDLPEELATILQYGSLGLTGVIENSLPLGLEMTYNFLDSEGNVVELMENAGKQVINPGTAGGEAVNTDLNILVGIKKGAVLTDISSVELVFTATTVPATPIREDSYIKATLQALIPEGVTIDLGQFMGNEQ